MADPQNQQPQNYGGGGATEVVNQLQNIARQLSVWCQSITNATPAATTTSSPKFTAVTLGTATVTVISTSVIRHGLLMHNPGTSNCYVYQTGMASAPNTTVLAGAIVIYPGGTLTLPSASFPNINAGFSGYALLNSQPFTVVEWF